MSGALEKSLAILEYLTAYPDGASLGQIATDLNQLRSGCHRTLQELMRFGYVRQMPQRSDYALTPRMASMGLSFLSKSGVVDIAQPVLARLAQATEELVRLAIVDGERLTLVAKAQGAKSGLMYDPDMGIDLRLSCSAAGQAWLMTLPGDEAIACASRQGLGSPKHYGPNAPTSIKALLKVLDEHRKRRYSIIQDAYAPGMSSMAAPQARRRTDHRRHRHRRTERPADAEAHDPVQPGPAGGRRGTGSVRQRLAAVEIRQRRHLGQPGRPPGPERPAQPPLKNGCSSYDDFDWPSRRRLASSA